MNLNDDLSVHTRIKSLASVKDTKDVPVSDCHSDDFGESECGEPLIPQRLVIDFTPTDEDTEFIEEKCCAFWEFIKFCPEIENCIVLPEPTISGGKSRSSDIELSSVKSVKTAEQQLEPVKTAVSMIEFVEEKGLITRAFEAKLPQSGCSICSLDYFGEKPTITHGSNKEVCTCSKVCKNCNAKPLLKHQAKTSPIGVQDMCKELRDWDAGHPKSMDPPGHPPILD